MAKKKSKYEEKVKLDMTFEEAIDKIFENRQLPVDKKLELIFKYNGLTLPETENEEIRTKLKEVIRLVKEQELAPILLSYRNPSYDLIPISPRGFDYEVDLQEIPEDLQRKISAIYKELFLSSE